mmetsp:Transcript_4946/g.8723  ORF Transcript_4946/g.8723 Transcript_4946/m.8723 type:complete len:347 (-) Transcript_4946:100-1140(-)
MANGLFIDDFRLVQRCCSGGACAHRGLDGAAHVPGVDLAVRVPGVEHAAVGGPAERGAVGHGRVLAQRGHLGHQLVHHLLALQVPDLDALRGGRAQPVAVGREHQRVDDVARGQRVQPLALVQVPEHGGAVLAARGAQAAVGGDSGRGQVARVPDQVRAQLAVSQGPHLHQLVPAGRDNDGRLGAGAEAHAGHPLRVALLGHGVLALAKGVPQLDSLVARPRHNLAVVSRECHGQHILGVSHKAAGGAAGGQLPQAQGAVPGAGQGELAVAGDHHVGDEVRVAGHAAAWVAVGVAITCEAPHAHGLVSRRRQDHVGILSGGSEGSHPSFMALQGTAQSKLFSHDGK